MTRTRIKICGITTAADADAVVAAGADAVGLVFYPRSPRAVTLAQAVEIARVVPPFVSVVALFVDEPADVIRRIIAGLPINLLQFHGEESAEYCQQFQRPWIKALRMSAGIDLPARCAAYEEARGILLDSWQEGVPGGTGVPFDWELARRSLPLPLVLAGGLDEHNVSEAIALLRPFAVDVSGGVEQAPGRKDTGKIKRFVAAVRAADALMDGTADDD